MSETVKIELGEARITINESVNVMDLYARLHDVFGRPELSGIKMPMSRTVGAGSVRYHLSSDYEWVNVGLITDHAMVHELFPRRRREVTAWRNADV